MEGNFFYFFWNFSGVGFDIAMELLDDWGELREFSWARNAHGGGVYRYSLTPISEK
jgi:hypothetical protein